MVTKGGRRRLKNRFLFFNLIHFKLSESFKSVDQGVPEIFEEVYLGGGGGTMCPPPPPPPWLGVGLRGRCRAKGDFSLGGRIFDTAFFFFFLKAIRDANVKR